MIICPLFIVYLELLINACARMDTESITMLCSKPVSWMARGISEQPRIMASEPCKTRDEATSSKSCLDLSVTGSEKALMP